MPVQEDKNDGVSIAETASPQALPELSAPVQEIISANPGAVLKNGTTIICCILLLAVAGLWLIKYPDTLEGRSVLTTDPLPIRLKAQSGGRLLQVFVQEGDSVAQHAVIAELENNTGYQAVSTLQSIADSVRAFLSRNDLQGLSRIASQELQSLGDAQPMYNQLLQAVNTFLVMKKGRIYAKRTANIEAQSNSYRSLSKIGREEAQMIDEELKQADERFKANEQLYREKIISRQEYFDETARLRQKKLSLEQQKRGGVQNNLSLGDTRKQLLDISYEQEEKENASVIAIQEAVRNLQNFIQSWKLRYLLAAPFAGQVQFLRSVQVNEVIAAGTELFAVIPASFQYKAIVTMPAGGSGKVKPGQSAQIYLDQFPFDEYGYLEGKVGKLSAMPELSNGAVYYRMEIRVAGPLVTTYHRQIPFTPEMAGQAKIVTKDRNLLQRLLSGFIRR